MRCHNAKSSQHMMGAINSLLAQNSPYLKCQLSSQYEAIRASQERTPELMTDKREEAEMTTMDPNL